MIRIIQLLTAFILSIVIQGCSNSFESIDGSYFKKRWSESSQKSVVSWWYFGKKNNTHYIMEKWVVNKYYYKVKEENFTITFEGKDKPYKKTDPINLKSKNVHFKNKGKK